MSLVRRFFSSLYYEILEKFIYLKWPKSEFKENGYEVIEGFLSEEECKYFVDLSDSLIKGQNTSYMINESAWLIQ